MGKKLMMCNHFPKIVIKIGEVEYWSCNKRNANEFDGDAVINLTGVPDVAQFSNIPELQAHVDKTFEEIIIAWPDFSLPRVRITFWEALHNYCVKKNWKRVCIHCEAGHGRTGTALSALLISLERMNVIQAISLVRANGCKEMVETPEQFIYLWQLDNAINGSNLSEEDLTSYLFSEEVEETTLHDDEKLQLPSLI